MTRRRMFAAGAAVALVLTLVGCSDQLGDRDGDEGAEPDRISDVDYIEVYRNADDFPNIALTCVEGIAFAVTSSREGTSAPSLLRIPEWDARCASERQTPAPSPSAS